MANDRINVVIADDNNTFIEGLKFILSKYQRYNVIEICCNGKELISCDKLYQADLVLSDIKMPHMNGIEAGKHISFKHPQLPMIALTMHIDEIYLIDIVGAGFKGFVYKPEVSRKLIDVIEQVLVKKLAYPEILKNKIQRLL